MFLAKSLIFPALLHCRVRMAVLALPIISSGLTLFTLAFDRFLAIVLSIKYDNIMKKLDVKYIVSFIWLVSLAMVLVASAFIHQPELGYSLEARRYKCVDLYESSYGDFGHGGYRSGLPSIDFQFGANGISLQATPRRDNFTSKVFWAKMKLSNFSKNDFFKQLKKPFPRRSKNARLSALPTFHRFIY